MIPTEKKIWMFNCLYIATFFSDVAWILDHPLKQGKSLKKYLWQRSFKIRLHAPDLQLLLKFGYFSGITIKSQATFKLSTLKQLFFFDDFFQSGFLNISKQSWRNIETFNLYMLYFLVTLCNNCSNSTVETEQGVKSVKLTIMIPEQGECHSGGFIVNIEQISDLVLVFLLLTLRK